MLTVMTGAALFAAEAVGMLGGEQQHARNRDHVVVVPANVAAPSATSIDDDKKIALSSTKTTGIFSRLKNVSTNASPNTHANPRRDANLPVNASDTVASGSGVNAVAP